MLAEYNHSYFERISRWSAQDAYRQQLEHLLGLLKLSSYDRVLDVGCGTGTLMRQITKRSGAKVQGVEPSPDAMPFLQGLNVTSGQAECLPFEDGTFDAVVMSHILGHIDDPQTALREAFRVLNPVGRLGIITPNRHFVRFLRPFNRLGVFPHTADPTIRRYYDWVGLRCELLGAGFEISQGGYQGTLPEVLGPLSRLERPQFLRQRVFAIASKPTSGIVVP